MLIYCDAGHGINTLGKRTPDGEREWTFNNKVVLAFMERMKKYKGVKVVRTDDPTGKRDVPLIERTNKANKANADIYISFHHNAFQSKWGYHTGVETYYNKNSTVGKKIAEKVQTVLVKVYGLRDRGIKTANLHITRETKMPAVLLEGGFMDSEIDIKKLRDKSVLEKAGEMVADAVAGHLGLNGGSKPKPKPTTPKPTPAPKLPKTDKLAVDGLWGPATTKALQRYFGTVVDGVNSGQPKNKSTLNIPSARYGTGGSQLIRAMQRHYGTTVDGYISGTSQLIKAMQRKYGTTADGFVSKPSLLVREIQRRLNNVTL